MTRYTFLPYLLLVVAPLAWVALRVRHAVSPPLRSAMGFALAALVVCALPFAGLDYDALKKLNLLLSGTMVAALLLRHARAPWWADQGNYRKFLGGMAVASVVAYFNFFSFHGGHAFMHLHDVAHYYLGSKYFHELGYGNLYTAMARAEAEEYSGVLWPREVRDLSINALVPVETVLRASEPIKQRFRPERWGAFRADVRYFRDSMGPRYAEVLVDHGYNPTPVWTLMGGTIANLVPAGSATGILLLTLLDPILEVAAFAAIGWAFGLETMLESVIYFCVLFGAMFTWVGGAYLRYVSFAAIIGAACCLRRQRGGCAGALLALATMLRVFPLFFAAGPLFQGVDGFLRTRSVPRSSLRFAASFALTALVLFLATCWIGDGYAQWEDFRHNTGSHMGSVSANVLGITNLPTYLVGIDVTGPGGLGTFLHWRSEVFVGQVALIFPLALGMVAMLSTRGDGVHAMALGAPLVLTAVNVSAYYYTFMVLLVLAYRDRAEALALLFAAEFLVYAFQLFDDHEVLMHLYKSALLLGVFAVLFGPELRAAVAERSGVARPRCVPAGPAAEPEGPVS